MHAQTNAQEDPAVTVMPLITPAAPWRLAEVKVLPDFCLQVRFNDGTEGQVDMAALVHAPDAGVFAALSDPAAFAQARIELGAVTWPGGQDLAPDAMHQAIRKHGKWVLN